MNQIHSHFVAADLPHEAHHDPANCDKHYQQGSLCSSEHGSSTSQTYQIPPVADDAKMQQQQQQQPPQQQQHSFEKGHLVTFAFKKTKQTFQGVVRKLATKGKWIPIAYATTGGIEHTLVGANDLTRITAIICPVDNCGKPLLNEKAMKDHYEEEH